MTPITARASIMNISFVAQFVMFLFWRPFGISMKITTWESSKASFVKVFKAHGGKLRPKLLAAALQDECRQATWPCFYQVFIFSNWVHLHIFEKVTLLLHHSLHLLYRMIVTHASGPQEHALYAPVDRSPLQQGWATSGLTIIRFEFNPLLSSRRLTHCLQA